MELEQLDLFKEEKRKVIPYTIDFQKKKELGSSLNTSQAQTMYRGTRNLVIPQEMRGAINFAESVYYFFAAGALKPYSILMKDLPHDFFPLAFELTKHAHQGLKDIPFDRWQHHFDRGPGEQRKRLEQRLSPESQKRFVDAFFYPYKPSNVEKEKSFYYDPTTGIKSPATRKMRYVDALYEFFELPSILFSTN